MTQIAPLRGTRDFYPELKRNLNYIFNVWKKVSINFGYEDFDGPLLEPAKLWQMKSGDEMPDQMYAFKDKGDRMVAIRPELTPTLARMIAKKSTELNKPIKWYSIPRCWRYEAPQSGRLREFFQLNVDCLGSDSMLADAEVIATAIEIMKNFKCSEKDFYIRLCNRKLIQALLESFGIKKMQDVMRAIDKKDKLNQREFIKELNNLKLKTNQVKQITDMISFEGIEKIDAEKLSEKGREGYEELKELLKFLKDMKLEKYVKVDFSIMRGFDYYTSTVFEVFDSRKKYRAIAGGGRYDNLVKDFGGSEKVSGVGYGMGDVVLELFLRENNKFPELKRETDYFVACMKKELSEEFLEYVNILREQFSVEIDIMGRNFSKQMNYANKIGAKKVIIIAPKEWEKKKIIVKDMETGKQEEIDVDKFMKKYLEKQKI